MMYNIYNRYDNKNSFLKKLTFMKKAALYTTTPMHCKARQDLRDLFSINQGNGSVETFAA